MRPDGSSSISVLNGEPLSAELAHELMGIQVITCEESCVVHMFIRFILLWFVFV